MASIQVRYSNKDIYIIFRYRKKQYSRKSDYSCLHDGASDCGCRNCIAALKYAKRVQDAIDRNTFRLEDYFKIHKVEINDPCTTTFYDYAYDWLRLNSRIAFSTKLSYERKLKNIFDFFGRTKLLKDVTRRDIQEMVHKFNADGFSPKHINHHTGLISTIMNDAVANGQINKNPAYKLAIKIPQKEIEAISPYQITQILDYIEKKRPSLAAYFAIGFFTGARTGEILALRRQDIDLKSNYIRFAATVTVGIRKESTKTNKIRYVEILPMLKPYLIKHFDYMDKEGLSAELFTHASGEPIVKYRTISDCWRPALKALGIPHQSQYNMRHAFASNMLVAQVPDTVVANILGHADLTMLHKTYGNQIVRNRNRIGTKFEEYFEESIKEEQGQDLDKINNK